MIDRLSQIIYISIIYKLTIHDTQGKINSIFLNQLNELNLNKTFIE